MTPSIRHMLVTAATAVFAVLLVLAVITARGLVQEAEYQERYERSSTVVRDLSQIESAFNVSASAGERYQQRLFRVVPRRLEALAERAAEAGLTVLARLLRDCGDVLARWEAGPAAGPAADFERHLRSQLLFSLNRASDEAWRIAVEHARELEARNRALTVIFAAGAAVLVAVMLLALGGTYYAVVRPLVRITGRVDRGEPALPGARGPLVAWEVRELAAVHDAGRAAREESENLLGRVVASLSEAVFVVGSPTRVVLMCNRAATEMFGWPEADLVGRETRHLHVDEDHYQDFGRRSEKVLESGGVFTTTFEMRRANGEVFPTEHEVRLVPEGPGSPKVVVSVVRDISERVAAERELQASHERLEQRVAERTAALSAANERLKELDRLKSLFIASMSHELRTPLNSVIGFTGLLLMDRQGGLSAEQRDYLERIRGSGDHLLSLVTDIIDVSKVEAGKILPHPVTVDVTALVDEAVAAVTPDVRHKGLWLRTECARGGTVVVDRKRLMQCLLNLLSNAVKYTEDGGITVHCDAQRGGVRLAVTDTGVGIAEEDLPQLWQQFSRINSPATRTTLGTGLGLYLTWRLARDVLGGEVGVESRPGEGSTFWLWLPAGAGQEPGSGYNHGAP